MNYLPRVDWIIFICLLLLAGFGGAIIISVAPEVFRMQLIFYLIGVVLFFVFSYLDYRIFENLSKLFYAVCLVGLIITFIIGFESRGSVRWIPLGPVHLQFSEIFKPFFVTAFATFLMTRSKSFFRFLLTLGLGFIPAFLVFRQPDLGSAIVYVAAIGGMLFASGAPIKYFAGVLIPAILALPIGWRFLAEYQKHRIYSFLNPSSDPLGTSYNAIQAVMTVGSGMLLGRGLGRGTQSHLMFLPERHTDFVFASAAEEMGFIGASFLLIVYFVLIWRLLTIARKSEDRYAMLIVVGVAFMLLTQITVNVGMNIGVLPVTGITLPLVSYGGSSILATCIGLGIVSNIARSLKGNSHRGLRLA